MGPSEPLTIRGVKVYRSGTRLDLAAQGSASVAPGSARPGLRLNITRNPIVAESMVELRWPSAGEAQVELIDASGRRMRTLFRGDVVPGIARIPLGGRDLPSGVYLLSARLGGERAIARAIVLH